MIFLKSFCLRAPYNNDVVQTCNLHWRYWEKYGFSHNFEPVNVLVDGLGTYSAEFHSRVSSAKLGTCTLSDFQNETRPGDSSAVYVFSVISTEEDIVDATISNVLPLFIDYVERKNRENSKYIISEVVETNFAFDSNENEGLNQLQKLERWKKLIELFPYVDKIYEWLMVNRNYPTPVN